MGGLYERAGASTAAVATVYARVRRRLLAALGLPVTTADDRLVLVAAERLAIDAGEIAGALSSARAGSSDAALTAPRAVTLVADLQRIAVRLDVVGRGTRTKA